MLSIYFLCILLLTSVDIVSGSGCTQAEIKQDLILMIDYSGSICPEITCCECGNRICTDNCVDDNCDTFEWSVNYDNFWCEYGSYARCCNNEWELLLDFTSSIVSQQLPTDTEVLTMGFGQPDGYVYLGWYAETIGDPNTIWKSPADVAAAIANPDNVRDWKVGGQTWLGAGIDFLLEESGVSWATERLDRKRLMLILSDGAATDSDTLCQRTPALNALGFEVVIVGITQDFAASSMSCIVEDTDSHIIKVDNWNGLDNFIEEVGRLTCESNQNWVLTEVKAGDNPSGDSDRFIEFTNIGVDYIPGGGEHEVRVESNIFAESYIAITTRANQFTRIVLGTAATAPAGCTNAQGSAVLCSYYGSLTPSSGQLTGPDGWTVRIYDTFTQSQDVEEILTVNWNANFPHLSDPTYSLELPNTGFDATLGANWRRSCAQGGSAGTANEAQCGPCSSDAECGNNEESGNTCCLAGASCDPQGCECVTEGYYDGSGTGSCQIIPQPPSCTFYVEEGRPENQRIVWQAAPSSTIFGYTVSAPGFSTSIYGPNLETSPNADQTIDVNGSPPTVQTIGELRSGNPVRWSKKTNCVLTYETGAPTAAPSKAPSPEPTEYQPLIFLGGFTLDDSNAIQDVIFHESDEEIGIDVRIYLSPPDSSVTVSWKTFDDANNEIESGTVEFPPDALAVLQDTKRAALTRSDYAVGSYRFVLQATTQLIQGDKPGVERKLYELYDPAELNFQVVPDERAPTFAPTDHQPLAMLGRFSMNNMTNEPNPQRFLSNEDITVAVRILPSVPFVVTLLWQVTEISSGTIVESGDVAFPADALYEQLDIQDVVLKNLTLNTDQYENDWLFEILPTTDEIPGDPLGSDRKLYNLLFPYSMNVTIERYVEQAVGISETVTEETLDWWLILIIVMIALGLLIVVGLVGYRYYVGYKLEKHNRKQAEEELAYEEDGIDGFYARAGVVHAQDNPLHRKPDTQQAVKNSTGDAEMIMAEDQLFSMDNDKHEFEQRMIGVDDHGKRHSGHAPVDPIHVAGASGGDHLSATGLYRGEASPSNSAYQIEEGSLPNSFNYDNAS